MKYDIAEQLNQALGDKLPDRNVRKPVSQLFRILTYQSFNATLNLLRLRQSPRSVVTLAEYRCSRVARSRIIVELIANGPKRDSASR